MSIKALRYFTKGIELRGEAADITDNVAGSIFHNSTSNRLKTYIQAAVREIVTNDQTQTLTNKTIDASANTVSNIATSMLASGVLNTSTTLTAASNIQIPSALAVKSYVDASLALQNDAAEIAYAPTGSIASTNVQTAVAEVSGDIDTHAAATVAHGATGAVVGTTNVQTLTNKTLTSPVINTPTGITKSDVGLGNVDNTSDATKNSAVATLTNKTIVATANTISAIADTNIAAGAAIARSKLATGTNSAILHNSPAGVSTDSSDLLIGTNALILANTKHLEIQAATDATTTGTAATLTAFTGGGIRLTNASLVSIGNIPAGTNGQEVVLFNRTGVAISVVDSSAVSGTAANRIFTGTSANISFAKDAALILSYDSLSARWQVIGGTGGGSSELPLDVLTQQTFESATLTDFTQTGLTLATTSNLLIKNTKVAQLISNASVTQSFKQVIAVDNEFRGKNLTLNLYTRSSATQGNVTLLVYNETGAVALAASQPITLGSNTVSATTAVGTTISALSVADVNKLKIGQTVTGSGIVTGTTIATINTTALTATLSQAATAAATVTLRISDLPQRQSFTFDVPTNCASLSYTISSLIESGSPESYFDDIAIKLTATALTTTSISQQSAEVEAIDSQVVANTFGSTNTGVPVLTVSNNTNLGIIQVVSNSVDGTYFKALKACEFKLNTIVNGSGAGTGTVFITKNSTILTTSTPDGILTKTSNVGTSIRFSFSDVVKLNVNDIIRIQRDNTTITGIDFFNITATAYTTISTNIPLTTSQLVQQPDSVLKLNTVAGYGSTATMIARFTNIEQNLGSAIQYTSSSVNGDSFTALQEGLYNISFAFVSTGSCDYGLSKNASSLTTAVQTLVESEVLTKTGIAGASLFADSVSVEAYLLVGDIVRAHLDGSPIGARKAKFSMSKASSLKQLNVSTDSKITIPTHSLRFEGASARGSTDTGIVKFDTQAITQGDGFSVVNSAANGTVITVLKAGKLSVGTSCYTGSANNSLVISKNQSVLTAVPTIASEVAGMGYTNSSNAGGASGTFDVVIGDKIRIASGNAVSASVGNFLSLSLSENSIPANFSNVLPQWSQSDSSVRLNTSNGYGSTGTMIRRYTNTLDNLGSAITYADSATSGASFTVNEDGNYNIMVTDQFNTSAYLGISKNSSQLTAAIHSITAADRLSIATTSATNNSAVANWSGFLSKNDVIRAHGDGSPVGNDASRCSITISKAGKPNLSSVDVTPFVNMKTTDVEAIEALTTTTTFGSTNTGVPVLNITRNTNLGVIRIDSSTANGTSFVALKDCEFKFNATFYSSSGSATAWITRNSSILTANSPDNVVVYSLSPSINVENQVSATIKLVTGDVVRLQRSTTALTHVVKLVLTASADNGATAAPVQQVSSDTLSFTFKATSIDPAVDAIGTFNTYTYASATNTAVIATSAPTQSTSSMNINGIQVFARPQNATSTSASPARVDIFIGKGLKSKQVDAYAGLLKSTPFSYDMLYVSSTVEAGTRIKYDEVLGILTINAATSAVATTTKYVECTDGLTSATNGYFVFNASKTPSLVTIPNSTARIATIKDVKPSGTSGGTFTSGAWQTRVLNTLLDATGIVTSLSSNQFTLPAGTYFIDGVAPTYGVVAYNKAKLFNVTDGVDVILGSSDYGGTDGSAKSIIMDQITITSPKTFEIRHQCSNTMANSGFGIANTGFSVSEVYAQVKITKIK